MEDALNDGIGDKLNNILDNNLSEAEHIVQSDSVSVPMMMEV
jgi:hypothetical protein